MKIAALGPDAVFYRYLTPKWAFVPLSGAGAAAEGGRFNRMGVEALYLAQAPQTALEEYAQDSSLVPPATLASYVLSVDGVVDLSGGYDPDHWADDWAQWDCSWRRMLRIDKLSPPSWILADQVISAGHKGILFPSIRHPGGTNLVSSMPILSPATGSGFMIPMVDFRKISLPGQSDCLRSRSSLWSQSYLEKQHVQRGA